jgi:methylthioribulose-1-phosphate dehydratase
MSTPRLPAFQDAVIDLAAAGHQFYNRNWVLGTSGNLSAVVGRDPLRVAITPSGAHKGRLNGSEFLEVDREGHVVRGEGRPSAETAIHLELIGIRGAGAVLHTHSVWSTILSDSHAARGGLALEGFEMLKGLEGVTTHEHREWLPIVANDQDMSRLTPVILQVLTDHPGAHGFLLRRHGLYTWGQTIAEAERHVEIFEFLLEVVGRGDAR